MVVQMIFVASWCNNREGFWTMVDIDLSNITSRSMRLKRFLDSCRTA